MCRLGLVFELRHAETQLGQSVAVVGDRQELGAWSAQAPAVRLSTSGLHYPSWRMPAPVWLNIATDGEDTDCDDDLAHRDDEFPDGSPISVARRADLSWVGASCSSIDFDAVRIEYKYVKMVRADSHGRPSVQWEEYIENRSVLIPLDNGSIWTISDKGFNDANEPPVITRTSLFDLLTGAALGKAQAPRVPVCGKAQFYEITMSEYEDDSCNSTRSSAGRHSTSTVAPWAFHDCPEAVTGTL